MDSTTYGAPSLNSDKVAVSTPESVPMETPKAQFFTKKCMAVSLLVVVLTSLVAVVCLLSLPSDEAENTDYGQMSISTDGSKFSGSGVISLMKIVRDDMNQNDDIGEREETVSFKLSHEPIQGNLRRLTAIAAEELNATIHLSSMPADQVPPEVEQVDFNDTTAAIRVGIISDAEPNDLMLLDCSLIEGTCVVNGTVANYNATSSDRRLDDRRLFGSWQDVKRTYCKWTPQYVKRTKCKWTHKYEKKERCKMTYKAETKQRCETKYKDVMSTFYHPNCNAIQSYMCERVRDDSRQHSACMNDAHRAVCGRKIPFRGISEVRDSLRNGGFHMLEHKWRLIDNLPDTAKYFRLEQRSTGRKVEDGKRCTSYSEKVPDKRICTPYSVRVPDKQICTPYSVRVRDRRICTTYTVKVYSFQRACFPASAQVITPSGLVAMDQTRPGMPVLTPTGFKPIYFMGDADQRVNSYVVLHIASGQQLTLSGDHFVQADGEYRFAKNVQIGQKLLMSNGSNSAVTSISFSFEQGAYNPYVEGGELIIDGGAASNGGIVASCHSSVGLFEGIVPDRYLPYIYEVLFKPILMIYYAKPKAIKVFHEMYVDQGAVSEHPITKISKDAVSALLA